MHHRTRKVPSMSSNVEMSVIIPTLNRCEVLARAVKSACTQSVPSDQYEIIVVDNGSSDGTRDAIDQLNQAYKGRIRYAVSYTHLTLPTILRV